MAIKHCMAAAISGLILMLAGGSVAQEQKPIKIGIVTFLSGAAAGPFGIPARNAAELFAAEANAGTLPAPYGPRASVDETSNWSSLTKRAARRNK